MSDGPNRRETLLGAAGAIALNGMAPRAAAAEPPAPRTRIRLAEGWRFHLGHAADVDRDFGFGGDQRTFAKAGVTSPATLAGFDDSGWQAIRVPHDWATDLPYAPPATPLPADRADNAAAHGFKAIGRDFPQNSVGWYRLALPIATTDRGRRLRLEFDGVFRDARVFVNGYAVAQNASGYAPFGVDITDFVDWTGPNLLALRVDASLGEGWFYEGAGIYRHVELVKTAPVHVPQWGVFVRSDVDSGGATVRIRTDMTAQQDGAASVAVRHRLTGPNDMAGGETTGAPVTVAGWGDAVDEAKISILAPQLWSIETPGLYRCLTELLVDGTVVDRVETAFGIRTIAFDAARGFFLNGKPVKLLGTCNHQDHAGVGTAIPDRLHAWRVEQLQSMGANAWRSAHNPPGQALRDACDAKGVMMIDEARLNSTSDEALDELTRMVRRDRNHPCVILWSVGNEEPQQGTPRGAHISAEMRRHILALDPTRPVTQAFDQAFDTGASRVVDVIGFNYRTDQIPAFHARFPDQPVIGTETGSTVSTRGAYANDAAAHVTRAYDTDHPWWASTAEQWWTIADPHPYIAGGFVWTGFDYRGEPTPFPSWPSVASSFGVLDLCGFPKDNYWYYRTWWRRDPSVHLLPHWTWPGREGQPIEVWAYANTEAVDLSLNGRSLGRKPVVRDGHLVWTVPYAPGRIEAIGYTGGKRVAAARVETAGAPATLRVIPDRVRLAADGADLAMVTIAVVDARGRLVPDATTGVRIEVAGPGRLIGAGNGDPTCHVPDHAADWPAFHGLIQAIVQTTGGSGPIGITATADGLRPGIVTTLAIPPLTDTGAPPMTPFRPLLATALLLTTSVTAAAPQPRPYLGADLSFANEMQDCGAVFRRHGKPVDPFALIAESGGNLVRVRLWNDATWTNYSGLSDVERTIRRAKAAGLQVLLDFHYSDDWADGDKQIAPVAWAGLAPADQATALHDYTRHTLDTLAAAGLMPDLVQVGNETNGGLLAGKSDKPIDWPRNAALLNAGITAVHEASAASGHPVRIMLHIAQPENAEPWFAAAAAAGVKGYDLIGLSYYRKWSKESMPELAATMQRLRARYGVDVMVVETAYPYTLTGSGDSSPNILGADSVEPGYPATPAGQRDYMVALTRIVLRAGGVGVVYWAPDWISTRCKTRWGTGSTWENATWFDVTHDWDALPVTDYLRERYPAR